MEKVCYDDFYPSHINLLKWSSLLYESVELFRNGKIKTVSPLKVFDVSELIQAYRYFALKTRVGKVVVSLEDPGSCVKVSLKA